MDRCYLCFIRLVKPLAIVLIGALALITCLMVLRGSRNEELLAPLTITRLLPRKQVLDETKGTEKWTQYSLEPDVIKRGKWQKRQVDEYCRHHKVPSTIPDSQHLYEHLLYDDKQKLIFCYVPKVGCSKWKYTFLLLNGIVPMMSLQKRLPERVLKEGKKLSDLSPPERRKRLATYFKFLFVRNPIERIVSAYRNKIAKPLNISLARDPRVFEEGYKAKILKMFKPKQLYAWTMSGRKEPIIPSFADFVRCLSQDDLTKVNEHLKPVIHLCHPCAINYNFYGNFKILAEDAASLLKRFHLNSSYYDQNSYISHLRFKTSDLVPEYFSDLKAEVKKSMYEAFSDELDFYFSLYPEEKYQHLSL